MTYFPGATNRVFMFGGIDTNGVTQNSTYKWNWNQPGWEGVCQGCLAPSESGRSSTRMVFFPDPINRIVMYGGQFCPGGGQTCQLSPQTTWLFNGTSWAPCGATCNVNPPAGRTSEGLAYDPRETANKVVVLFAGDDRGRSDREAPLNPRQDTWTLTGTGVNDLAWLQCPESPGSPCQVEPGKRGSPGMEYDQLTGNLVVFGGSSGGPIWGDTWFYNTSFSPNYWQQCTSPDCEPENTTCTADPPPCVRFGHRMVYDTARGRIFLFGSGKPNELNDVWFYDGNPTRSWQRCDTALEGCDPLGTRPATRCCFGLAFDYGIPGNNRILVYGGAHGTGHMAYDDTWSWDPTSGWTCLAGTCATG